MTRQVREGNKSLRVYRSFDGRPPIAKSPTNKPLSHAKAKLPQLGLKMPRWRLIVGVLALLLLLKLTYISTISVVGVKTPDKTIETSIKNATISYTHERPWRRFQLFISSRDLEKALREEVPNATNISVKRSLFSNSISVSMLPKQPSAKWQQGRGGQIYVVDTIGRAFMQARGDEGLPLIISENPPAQGTVTGQIVVDAAAVQSAMAWRQYLPSAGLTLDAFLIDGTPKQAVLLIKDKPWRIKVSTDTSANESINYLKKSLEKIAADKKALNEYIDIRIPYRVFYK